MYFCIYTNESLIYKVGHIILAVLLFISSSGLLLNRHFCQNELKTVAFFVPAEGCHRSDGKVACPIHQGMDKHQSKKEKKGCCKDESELLKTDENQAFSFNIHQADLQALTPALFFPTGLVALHRQVEQTHLPAWQQFKPPIACDNIHSRLQVFRL